MKKDYTYLNSLVLLFILFLLMLQNLNFSLHSDRLNTQGEFISIVAELNNARYDGQEKINIHTLKILAVMNDVNISGTLEQLNKKEGN